MGLGGRLGYRPSPAALGNAQINLALRSLARTVAEHLVEECYFDDLNGMSDLIRNNIDWRGVAREIFMDGYEYEDGFFLRKLRKRQADNVFYRR